MKYLLTIKAHGDTVEDAIRHARTVLDHSAHGGTPRGVVAGGSTGSAGSTWRLLTLTDEGDNETAIRRIGCAPPERQRKR